MAVPRRFRTRVALHRTATVSRLILECLADFGTVALSSFFPAKYPEARIWRALLGLDDDYEFCRESFSTLLGRLKNQGLVARVGSKRGSRWLITKRGRAALRGAGAEVLPRPDGIQRIVAFDIPERERKKRDAIRWALAAAGYEQLQKSVWQGTRPLPEDFLELIDTLDLGSRVHVFSVRSSGTLRR